MVRSAHHRGSPFFALTRPQHTCRIGTPRYAQCIRPHSLHSQRSTAICVSIDRFAQNTVPICCLPFDDIGARHPGMTHNAGARSSGHNSFPLSGHSQKLMSIETQKAVRRKHTIGPKKRRSSNRPPIDAPGPCASSGGSVMVIGINVDDAPLVHSRLSVGQFPC